MRSEGSDHEKEANMRRIFLAGLLLGLWLLPGAAAAGSYAPTIQLPNGFQPEGIAISDTTFFVGSIPTGAVFRGDLETGEGAVLVPPAAGRAAIGLDVDSRDRIFVAGGATGKAFVYSARSGKTLATFSLTEKETFVNDVVVTPQGAWFTDSLNPVLYKLFLRSDGSFGRVKTVPLSGAIRFEAGFNVNGIDAVPDGKRLVIVQTNTGRLFSVDAASGATKEIDLGGESVPNGDGVLLDGRVLYVVQNVLNTVAVIALSADLSSGSVTTRLEDPRLDTPTTIDDFGKKLYTVNARFGTEPTPDTEYSVVQLRKP
jgi:sugar lactone lactonase YvrE